MLLALGLCLLVAQPASAHPFFRGGEAPVNSLVTLTLAMAHGCGDEASGQGAPTTEVALEAPDWLRIVDVPEPDGWEVDLEVADDGRVEVVTWTAPDATEPAPDFDLDVVVTGEVGDERYVRVLQACDDQVYRWVGTPDAPADDPAIRLRLVDADPDSPPPPLPDPDPAPDPPADPGPEPGTDGGTTDEPTDTDPAPGPDGADAPGDDGEVADRPGAADGAPDLEATPIAARSTPWWPVALAAVVAAVVVAVVVRRRAGGEDGPT